MVGIFLNVFIGNDNHVLLQRYTPPSYFLLACTDLKLMLYYQDTPAISQEESINISSKRNSHKFVSQMVLQLFLVVKLKWENKESSFSAPQSFTVQADIPTAHNIYLRLKSHFGFLRSGLQHEQFPVVSIWLQWKPKYTYTFFFPPCSGCIRQLLPSSIRSSRGKKPFGS